MDEANGDVIDLSFFCELFINQRWAAYKKKLCGYLLLKKTSMFSYEFDEMCKNAKSFFSASKFPRLFYIHMHICR